MKYEPFSENGVMGFSHTSEAGLKTFIYLNPSSDDSEGVANVFVYHGHSGDPVNDRAITHVCFDDGITDVAVVDPNDGTIRINSETLYDIQDIAGFMRDHLARVWRSLGMAMDAGSVKVALDAAIQSRNRASELVAKIRRIAEGRV